MTATYVMVVSLTKLTLENMGNTNMKKYSMTVTNVIVDFHRKLI